MRLFKRTTYNPVGYAMSFYDGKIISEITYTNEGIVHIMHIAELSGITLEEDLTEYAMEELI